MSWDNGTIGGLLAGEQYKTGMVGSHALKAVVQAARDNQARADQPVPAQSSITDANGTAQTLRGSAGRLYLIRVVNTDNDAISVTLTDGGTTIVVGGCTCPAGATGNPGVCEVAFFGGAKGAGQSILTDLRVRAYKSSDGTTPADAGNTVTALTSAA
jgi:hypothetical protein